MGSNRQLKEAIQKLSGTFNKDIVSIVVCNVTAVNEGAQTCDCEPISGDAITDIPDVQLSAEVSDGILLIPKIGSTVIVGMSIRNTAFVLMVSDVDKIIFRGGQFGGLIKIENLVDKINNVENLLNDFILKYNTHTHVLTLSAGTGTAAPTETQETSNISPITNKNDIENLNITHG